MRELVVVGIARTVLVGCAGRTKPGALYDEFCTPTLRAAMARAWETSDASSGCRWRLIVIGPSA